VLHAHLCEFIGPAESDSVAEAIEALEHLAHA
jgi:hypothetical protein